MFLIANYAANKNSNNNLSSTITGDIAYTYKWNDSLYLGDQLFDFDLVACLRFLSCKCGPIKLISTNGRNIPDWITHLRSLAATTETLYQYVK